MRPAMRAYSLGGRSGPAWRHALYDATRTPREFEIGGAWIDRLIANPFTPQCSIFGNLLERMFERPAGDREPHPRARKPNERGSPKCQEQSIPPEHGDRARKSRRKNATPARLKLKNTVAELRKLARSRAPHELAHSGTIEEEAQPSFRNEPVPLNPTIAQNHRKLPSRRRSFSKALASRAIRRFGPLPISSLSLRRCWQTTLDGQRAAGALLAACVAQTRGRSVTSSGAPPDGSRENAPALSRSDDRHTLTAPDPARTPSRRSPMKIDPAVVRELLDKTHSQARNEDETRRVESETSSSRLAPLLRAGLPPAMSPLLSRDGFAVPFAQRIAMRDARAEEPEIRALERVELRDRIASILTDEARRAGINV